MYLSLSLTSSRLEKLSVYLSIDRSSLCLHGRSIRYTLNFSSIFPYVFLFFCLPLSSFSRPSRPRKGREEEREKQTEGTSKREERSTEHVCLPFRLHWPAACSFIFSFAGQCEQKDDRRDLSFTTFNRLVLSLSLR